MNKNNTNILLPEFTNIADMIEYAVNLYGDKTAYSSHNGTDIVTVSYKKMKEDILRYIAFLNKNGCKRDNIFILSENRYEYIVLFCAAICSDNIAVPINKDIEADIFQHLYNECTPKLLFFTKRVSVGKEWLTKNASHSVLIDFDEMVLPELSCSENKNFPKIESDSIKEPCCLVYTSGTKGLPKGVMLSQANIISNVVTYTRRMPMKGSMMLCLPLHHMYAWTSSLFMPMMNGMNVIINEDNIELIKDMKQFSPDNIVVVPAILEFFYKRITFLIKKSSKSEYFSELLKDNRLLEKTPEERRSIFAEVTGDLGTRLGSAITGAAMLNVDMECFFEKIGVILYSIYGTTECSPLITVCDLGDNRIGSVGSALECNEISIHNPDENGIGEIYVQGRNVMLGYYKRPEETINAFDGEWFKSGDLARIDNEGFVYITGRIKNLIIRSSGENVSPEELEERIMTLPNVKETLVSERNGLIVAEVYPDVHDKNAIELIHEGIKKINLSLPSYKRIDITEITDVPFERTSTKKIKRH